MSRKRVLFKPVDLNEADYQGSSIPNSELKTRLATPPDFKASFQRDNQKNTWNSGVWRIPADGFSEINDDDAKSWKSRFMLRGPTYLEDKIKVESKSPAFECVGMALWENKEQKFHAVEYAPGLKEYIADNINNPTPLFLIVNWVLPGPPHYSQTMVFAKTLPEGEDETFDRNLKTFLEGDDDVRNSKLKFIFNLEKAPWVVSISVNNLGGQRPVILGNRLTCQHFSGDGYVEVDIDVGSSKIAHMTSGILLKATNWIVCDLAFTFEGHKPEELPERLIGLARCTSIDMPSIADKLFDDLPPGTDNSQEGPSNGVYAWAAGWGNYLAPWGNKNDV